MIIYRNDLKKNVKDELMRSGAVSTTLEELSENVIRLNDLLWERAIEKKKTD